MAWNRAREAPVERLDPFLAPATPLNQPADTRGRSDTSSISRGGAAAVLPATTSHGPLPINPSRAIGRVEGNTMASSLVAASLQGLPHRRNIAHIVATPLPHLPISPGHMKVPINVQNRSLSSEKPLISGSGITCSIQLAEPHVYLTGFDHDGRGNVAENTAALIRGKLVLDVHKSVKIKAVTLRFYGKARTEWPEGRLRLRHGSSYVC